MSFDPWLEHLKRRGMLVETGLTEDEIARKMRRTSGEMICAICGKDYYHHPYVSEARDGENHPYLNIICDSSIVKL